jgi:hypothetical protein
MTGYRKSAEALTPSPMGPWSTGVVSRLFNEPAGWTVWVGDDLGVPPPHEEPAHTVHPAPDVAQR